jgi:hypothetical protein
VRVCARVCVFDVICSHASVCFDACNMGSCECMCECMQCVQCERVSKYV